MPFVKGNCSEIAAMGGSVVSERKTKAAQRNGKLGGSEKKPLVCTCDQLPHKSNCRAYMTMKKRESRKRLK